METLKSPEQQTEKQKPRRNVFWLGLTSLFTDVSSEMIFPVLPIFLQSVLRAPIAAIGLIEGIAESASALFKFLSGWVSDRIQNRKRLTALGYLLSTITKPFFAIATAWPHVAAFRFLDRVGKGVRTAPRDALIKESVPQEQIGRSFGLHRAMDTAGAILGVFITAFILLRIGGAVGGNLRFIFWISAIPAVLAVFILILFVHEPRKPPTKTKTNIATSNDAVLELKEKKSISFFQIKNLSKKFQFLLLIAALYSFGGLSYAFFILRAQNIGLRLALVPLVYLVYNLAYAVIAYPAGRLSDKIGRAKLLGAGFLLFALTNIGFAFAATPKTVWFLFALYGMFIGVGDTLFRALVSDVSSKETSGTAFGAYHTVTGIAVLPANVIGGLLWQYTGAASAFIFSAVMVTLAAILIFQFEKFGIKHKPAAFSAEQFKGYR